VASRALPATPVGGSGARHATEGGQPQPGPDRSRRQDTPNITGSGPHTPTRHAANIEVLRTNAALGASHFLHILEEVPQPGPSRGTSPQTRRAARGDRGGAGPDRRRGADRSTHRSRQDRCAGRQSARHIQDGQALCPPHGPGPLTYTRDQAAIAAQAAIDGIYLLRTSIATDQLDTPAVVSTDKALARVERDFRSLKTIDIQLRPIHHHTQPRVRAHVFLCLLAAYLLWHLRQALAPLTYTDQHPPERTNPANPVAPATGSTSAQRKARTHPDADGQPLHSFQGLLDHLGSPTRNELRFPHLPDAPV
jgi:hypothetical protein